MSTRQYLCVCGLIALLTSTIGCEKPAPPPLPRTDTGAEKVAKKFFDAIVQEDWSAAFETLDADSQSWCPKDQFSKLGKDYRALIDFTPTDVAVTVTETQDHATAMAIFRGVSGTEMKSYKDGTALQNSPKGWAVVLRKNFGKKSSAPSKG